MAETPTTGTPEMLKAVEETAALLSETEENCQKLAVACNRGFKLGMMDACERDELANDFLSIRHRLLRAHAGLTRIAKRSGADGGLSPMSGPGR